MNKAILVGHLGQDPELKFTQGGTAILKLRMATSDKRKDKDGKWQEQTEWHTVIVWGKRGEALSKILHKGSCLAIEGRIQTRSYEDKGGGAKRYATEINADDVQLIGGKSKRNPASDGDGFGDAPDSDESAGNDDDDQVPF